MLSSASSTESSEYYVRMSSARSQDMASVGLTLLAGFLAAVGLLTCNWSEYFDVRPLGEPGTSYDYNVGLVPPMSLLLSLFLGTIVAVLLWAAIRHSASRLGFALAAFASAGIGTSAVFIVLDGWNQIRKLRTAGILRSESGYVAVVVGCLVLVILIYAVIPALVTIRAVKAKYRLREFVPAVAATAGVVVAMLLFFPYSRAGRYSNPPRDLNCGYHFFGEDRDSHDRKDCDIDFGRFWPPVVAVAATGLGASIGLWVWRLRTSRARGEEDLVGGEVSSGFP